MGASMAAKRALIVDDSKSARLFLARILEKYELDVDNAENAESAIEYLATHRPDVIFMDHMMPGMDGFQAVQAIKNNPRTATIPIMMYTSQEGELYLGQARALGAVGVLPKQIKQADVSKVLYQLHLVTDRRRAEQTTFTAVNAPVMDGHAEVSPDLAAIAAAADPTTPVALTTTSLREQFAELRRALVAGVDTQTDRITAEVRALLLESLPPPPPGAQPPRDPVPWGWVVASAALAIALVSTTLWWRNVNQLNEVKTEIAQLRTAIAGQQGAKTASVGTPPPPSRQGHPANSGPQAGAGAALAETLPGLGGAGAGRVTLTGEPRATTIVVPYGTDALGGMRLEAVRQLVYRLAKDNTSGVVDIKTFAGRFCLVGNSVDGFSLAPDETLFAKCDLVGNPSDDALSPAQRTPLALANLAGDVRHSTHGALQVQSSVGDTAVVAVPYPPLSSDLTAGEWNRAAGTNNRVEIRVR
jgi:CheY-like chemotaxis protein